MTIKVVLSSEGSYLEGPFPFEFLPVISALSGGKHWKSSTILSFDDSGHNIELLKSSSFLLEFEDKEGRLEKLAALRSQPSQHARKIAIPVPYYPKVELKDYQELALSLGWSRENYAYFLEVGLGKTAIVIHNSVILKKMKKVSGVIVITKPGIGEQWIDEQLPEHCEDGVRWEGRVWNGKPFEVKKAKDTLHYFCIHFQAMRTQEGKEQALRFCRLHNTSLMGVIDESQMIKTWSADQTQACFDIREYTAYRRLLTGTPIAKNLMDMWSQFKWLDEDILGHRFQITFEKEYCLKGGFKGKKIVGNKNIEQFYLIIAPHSFRYTKAEAGMEAPTYATTPYVMGSNTRKHFNNFKIAMMTEFDDGSIATVKSAVAGLMRLQQIVCGYLPNDKKVMKEISSERIDVLCEMIEDLEGPIVIWCRFQEDVARIAKRFDKEKWSYVTYTGKTKKGKERTDAKNAFNSGKARFFIGIAQAGGTGLNLQKSGCENVIYYSNSFASLDRWQSEGRTHRLGMKKNCRYFDIICRGSPDTFILRSLRQKKSLSDLTLDQIRQAVISLAA